LIVLEHPAYTSSSLGLPALRRFITRAKKLAGLQGEVSVLLADDARLKELNRDFRKKNKATDVLSFPVGEGSNEIAGDLAISLDTAARQAEEFGHPLDKELRILTLHGLLHLAGYDHEADTGEMAEREAALRLKLILPDGLIQRANKRPTVIRKHVTSAKPSTKRRAVRP
jgi:probable rRNA maturation factor